MRYVLARATRMETDRRTRHNRVRLSVLPVLPYSKPIGEPGGLTAYRVRLSGIPVLKKLAYRFSRQPNPVQPGSPIGFA